VGKDALTSLTLRYDAEEDRLALRLVLGAEAPREMLTYLTRRITQQLRSQLQTLAEQSAQAPERLPPSSRSQVEANYHHAVASQVPTTAGPPIRPQGEGRAPLVTRAQCGRVRGGGSWVIRLDLREAEPMTITLTDSTLHATIALINRQVAAAGWDLPVMAIQQANGAAPEVPLLRELH